MNMKEYERDHQDILAQYEQLQELMAAGISANAARVSDLLRQINTNIRLHLVTEERFLYPVLQESDHADAAEIGERFAADMIGLYQRFTEYIANWRDPAAIEAEPEHFEQATTAIFKALGERIQREESELHPVAAQV